MHRKRDQLQKKLGLRLNIWERYERVAMQYPQTTLVVFLWYFTLSDRWHRRDLEASI